LISDTIKLTLPSFIGARIAEDSHLQATGNRAQYWKLILMPLLDHTMDKKEVKGH
jgi:hypothetical protein